MCFAAADVAQHVDSQIAAFKYAHCQNLHVDTIPTTITSKYLYKCFVCSNNWYESQVVSGNALELLGVKMVQQNFDVSNLLDAKTTTTVEK